MIRRLRRPAAMAIVLLAAAFLWTTAPARAASVEATVDRNTLALGESLDLQVSAAGIENGEVDVAPIRDFKVLARGQSTNIRIINGQASRNITFNYTLIPLKAGDLRIPPLRVNTPEGTFRTRRIDITVSERSQERREDRDIFVTAEVSEDYPYVGEQLVYTFRLYRTRRITEAQFQKPEFTGFTAEQTGEERSDVTVIEGRRFHTTTLSYVLIPLQPGPKTIQPAILRCGVVQQDPHRRGGPFDFDSLFGGPFFGRGRVETRVFETAPIDVTIRPLPQAAPDDFSGLVGTMDIRAQVEKTDLKTGDATTLTLTIEGAGNLMDAEAPDMDFPEEIKVYGDAPQSEITINREGYVGKKTFGMALVPLTPGTYRLPPAEITYFDTTSETYVTRRTAAFTLTVGEGDAEADLTVASPPTDETGPAKQEVAFTGRDILPIRDDLSALDDRRPLSLPLFLALLGIPAMLFAGIGGVLRVARRGTEPARLMARRARTSLKKAAAPGIGADRFLSLLDRGLVSAIRSRAGTPGESLTGAEAETILRETGFPPETGQAAAGLLERIESAKFGGAALASGDRQRLLSETRHLVRRLS